jgi:uncharacterized protein (DUF305 family)
MRALPILTLTAGTSIACGGEDDRTTTDAASSQPSDEGAASGSATGDRRVPFTPTNDRQFAEFFIEHHQMAVDMAQHVVERGESTEIMGLAQRIVNAQTAELATLQTAVAAIGTSQPGLAQSPHDPHTDADMKYMAGLSGADLDAMFLMDMIPHHAAGLAPAHRAQSDLARPELQVMATNIFETQSAEIGEMRAFLADMGVADAGEDRASAVGDRPDFGLDGDRRIPLTPANDLEFVDFFITHHQMAMEMAEHEVAHGENPEVIALAEAIIAAQGDEVGIMGAVRASIAGSASPPPMPEDAHADAEMMAMMAATGTELDRIFVTEMIPHHAAGLPTAHRSVPHVQNEQLRTLAADMYQAQSEEIGAMQSLLTSLE